MRDIATTTTTRAHTTTTRAHTTTPRAHTTTTQATTTSKSDNWWAYARTPRPTKWWYGDWRNRVRRRITTPPRRYTTTTPWSGHRNYGREKEADSSSIKHLAWMFSVSILICVLCICHKKATSDGADTSIDQAEESLPTYSLALSMPSFHSHMPVPLPAPSLDDGRSPPAYSEINMQLSTSALRVSTVGWATRSPVASVNNMTTMTRY